MKTNVYFVGETHLESVHSLIEYLSLTSMNERRTRDLLEQLKNTEEYCIEFYEDLGEKIIGKNNAILIEGYDIRMFFLSRHLDDSKFSKIGWLDSEDYSKYTESDEDCRAREDEWIIKINEALAQNMCENLYVIAGLYHFREKSKLKNFRHKNANIINCFMDNDLTKKIEMRSC